MNSPLPAPGAAYYKLPSHSEPFHPKKPLSFMTLIVGLKSERAIVFAADRQISYGDSSLRTDVEKIERIDFANFPAMVALADNVDNAHHFIDVFRGIAKSESPQSAEDVCAVAKRAMWVVRGETKKIYEDEKDPLDDVIRTKSLNCSATIGFLIDGTPEIAQINLLTMKCAPSRAKYETDGCGANLADFLLREYHEPKLNFDRSVLLAAYIVWVVTQHDRYCREPITIGAIVGPGGLDSDGKPRLRMFSPERVARLVNLAKGVDQASKKTRHQVIHDYFAARDAEIQREMEQSVKLWEASELWKSMELPDPVEESQRYLTEGHGTDPATEKE